MKNKLWKIMIVNSILISAITLSGKTTVSVHAGETDISAESEENQQILFDDAVEDAMIIDKDEILPVVSPLSSVLNSSSYNKCKDACQ